MPQVSGHSGLTAISQLSEGELLFLLTHTLVENINVCIFVNIPVLYPEFYRKTHKKNYNSATAAKYDYCKLKGAGGLHSDQEEHYSLDAH